MNRKYSSQFLMVTGWVLGSLFLGCTSIELTKVPKKPLPATPPQLTELSLELPPQRGPRRPVDAVAATTLSGPGPDITIVEMDQPALRTTAEQDAAVKKQLGDRFAYIDSEEVPVDRCLIPKSSEDRATLCVPPNSQLLQKPPLID